uniref:Peptidase S59 domain-containing protein n=1 Tax=Spongospora subterranea TaxID=70186 RepID=A0A0H5R6I2_9EUKA|eukprot:CRZ09745.1 hypothetical protein [Spongospora subterranea]
MSFSGFGTTPSSSSPFGAPAFGQPAPQQTGLFGATPSNTFGATPSNTFGTTSSNTFGSTSSNTFGAQPLPSSTLSNSWSGGFGAQSSPFGGGAATTSSTTAARTGTQHTSYTTTTEAAGKGRLISITAMPAYKDKSFEELRYEDYTMQKGQVPILVANPTSAPVTSGFGSAPTATPSTPFGGFGTSTTPTATSSSGFGGGFGSTSVQSSFGSGSSFGGGAAAGTFGAPAPSPFGQQTSSTPQFGFGGATSQPSTGFGAGASTSTFGQAQTPTAFGQTPFGGTATPQPPSTPSFGTQSTGLFGSTHQQPSQTSIFSSAATPSAPSSGLFGAQPAGGLFGQAASQPAPQGGLFGSSASTIQPSGGTGLFGTTTPSTPSSGGLFGSTATRPAPTTTGFSFGGAPAPTPTAPSTGFGFGAATTAPAAPSTSLFGGGQTTQQAAPSTGFSFGSSLQQPSTSTFGGFGTTNTAAPAPATTPFSFGGTGLNAGSSTSLFGNTMTPAKSEPTSLFGAPGAAPSFQFGSAQPTASVQPQSSGLFGSLSMPQQQQPLSSQFQVQPYIAPTTAPTIDSNPFALSELPVPLRDVTTLSFQATPSTASRNGMSRPGLSAAKPTPQSVARLRSRTRRSTPSPSPISPFDESVFSISSLTSAAKSSIPKVFRPKMPPKIELPDRRNVASPVPEVHAPANTADRSATSPKPQEPEMPRFRPSPLKTALPSFSPLVELGYTFSPELDVLEAMSDEELRCVTLQITKEGCGFARWENFDLTTWAGLDLTELIQIDEKAVRLKGASKRGTVMCGIRAKTEAQASKAYEDKVRQFMAAKGYTLIGLENGYYAFYCQFSQGHSTQSTPSKTAR